MIVAIERQHGAFDQRSAAASGRDDARGVAALWTTRTATRAAPPESRPERLPLNNDRDAIARVLWQLTDREYEQASSAFLNGEDQQGRAIGRGRQVAGFFARNSRRAHLGDCAPRLRHWIRSSGKSARGRFPRDSLKYPEVYDLDCVPAGRAMTVRIWRRAKARRWCVPAA